MITKPVKLNVTFRVTDNADGIRLLELLERISGGGAVNDPRNEELLRKLREATLVEGKVGAGA